MFVHSSWVRGPAWRSRAFEVSSILGRIRALLRAAETLATFITVACISAVVVPLAALFVFRGKRVAAVMLALLKAAAVVAAAVALDSVSECPGGESGGWTFRDGRCYAVSEGEHSFDDCNRVYCPSRAASDHVSAGTTSEETATLACWRDEATSDFLYEVGRGADEGMRV